MPRFFNTFSALSGCLVLVALPASAADLHATTADLWNVAKASAPGDTINLAGGNYGVLNLYNMSKAAPGVIVQPEPGASVVMAGINLNITDGFTFRAGPGSFEVTPDPRTSWAVTFSGAATHFDGLKIHGDCSNYIDAGNNGVIMRNATGGSITNNEVYCLATGINHQNPLNNGDTIVISGNHLHQIRSDGIRGQSSKVLISHNTGTDFHYAGADHPDWIQFWTTGLSAPLHDITIEFNDWRKGPGLPAQCIFVGNENKLPFQRVVIHDNICFGTFWHALSISYADSPVIYHNYIQGNTDSIQVGTTQVMVPWIGVFNSTNPKITNNTSTTFRYDSSTGVVESGSVTIKNAAPGDISGLTSWLKGLPAVVTPERPPVVVPVVQPVPTVDPREAMIADLRAQLSASQKAAAVAASNAQAAATAASAQIADLGARLDGSAKALAAAQGRIAAAQSALTQ